MGLDREGGGEGGWGGGVYEVYLYKYTQYDQ